MGSLSVSLHGASEGQQHSQGRKHIVDHRRAAHFLVPLRHQFLRVLLQPDRQVLLELRTPPRRLLVFIRKELANVASLDHIAELL